MIVLHPRIHTLHPTLGQDGWGTVEAIRTQNGRVVFAGSRADALALRADGEAVVEPEAACVLPGLIDTHAHLTGISMRPDALDLPDDTPPRALAGAVSQAAARLNDGEWITGRAWNQAVWSREAVLASGVGLTAEGFPDHRALTAAAPNNPVMLHRTDQHAVWVNKAAMLAAGIDRDTADVEGGRIVRDAQGEPVGIFVDEAVGLVRRAIPALTSAQHRRLLRENAARFMDRGVTCVHCAMLRPHELDDYATVLRGADAPGLRVRGMVYLDPAELAQYALEHAPEIGTEGWWSVQTLKIFADGALGSKGAWFYEPYEGKPETRGLVVTSPEAIEAVARAALPQGWQIATHAIGPRAIAETVEAMVRGGWTPQHSNALRWRIEHVQHPRAETLDRMAELGLWGTMQPIHATRDMRYVRGLIGPERESISYPWRALLSRNIPLGFGSDFPIETLDPWVGIHAAVTRQDERGHPEGGWFPEHRVTLLEAVQAYTRHAAGFVRCDEGALGHLAKGARADWIAASTDPAIDAPETVLKTSIASMATGGVLRR